MLLAMWKDATAYCSTISSTPAGTLINAAKALMDKGATSVSAYTTHGVLSGNAVERISGSAELERLVISDSIEATPSVDACGRIETVSISGLLAEAIRRIANEESVSSLFD